MKQYIIVISVALCLVSCSHRSKHWETLAQVESYIEERPDSALNVLQGMDKGELSGKEEKAKHALLLSMAMDKNYIDRTDFDVLQPAIDFYEDHGSATDKLRTYYYQGRIYQNAGNDAAAMESFVNSLDVGSESNDNLTKARILVAQSNIYYSLMKWKKVCDVNIEAANYYNELGRTNNYVYCLLRCIGGYIQSNNFDKAKDLLGKCYQYTENLPELLISEIYSYHLLYSVAANNFESVPLIIGEYNNKVSEENIDYLTVVGAYADIGAYDKAEDMLVRINTKSLEDNNKTLKYYTTLIRIYRHKGDYRKVYESYLKFNELNDSILFSIFESDTQFIEERHALEMQKARETEAKNRLTIIVLACVIALMSSLYILYFIRKRLKETKQKNIQLENEKAHYEKMYLEVLSERKALNDMISNSAIKDETMEIIKKRLGVLNTIIVSHLSEKGTDVKRANEELEKLIADRNDFIKSTRLTLEENYPHFFAYLHDKGLEEFEIDFCCLYAIGLKGKEIKTYTNLSRHYKDSSEVRHKLGLVESDTNLSKFLQKLLKNEVE